MKPVFYAGVYIVVFLLYTHNDENFNLIVVVSKKRKKLKNKAKYGCIVVQ